MTRCLLTNDRIDVALNPAGIAHVRLMRADKLNALDTAMFEAIAAAGHALHGAAGVRAVVLSGEGRAFCAGLDLSVMQGALGRGELDLIARSHGKANLFQQAAMVWRTLPAPVIAAIHGACLGGGLQVAAGADIRVTAPDARLCVMEARWGLVPDMGHFALWRGLVREDHLRELTYTARQFTGVEALALGFASHVDADPLGRAMAIAGEIAAHNPHAMRAAKALFGRLPELDTAGVLMEESLEQARLIGSANQIEAVRSAMEGRQPVYRDG